MQAERDAGRTLTADVVTLSVARRAAGTQEPCLMPFTTTGAGVTVQHPHPGISAAQDEGDEAEADVGDRGDGEDGGHAAACPCCSRPRYGTLVCAPTDMTPQHVG